LAADDASVLLNVTAFRQSGAPKVQEAAALARLRQACVACSPVKRFADPKKKFASDAR
jgi:hypothetical protein